MADHLAPVAVRFASVLGLFVFGSFVLWLGRQAVRGVAWCFAKVQRRICA